MSAYRPTLWSVNLGELMQTQVSVRFSNVTLRGTLVGFDESCLLVESADFGFCLIPLGQVCWVRPIAGDDQGDPPEAGN